MLIKFCKLKRSKSANSIEIEKEGYSEGFLLGTTRVFVEHFKDLISSEKWGVDAYWFPLNFKGRVIDELRPNGNSGKLWLDHYDLIVSGEINEHLIPTGGEETLFGWTSEGGKYSHLYFEKDTRFFEFDNVVPKELE